MEKCKILENLFLHWKHLVNIFGRAHAKISAFLRSLINFVITLFILGIFWHDPNVKYGLRCRLCDINFEKYLHPKGTFLCRNFYHTPKKFYIKKTNFMPFGCRYWDNSYGVSNTIHKAQVYFNMIEKLLVKGNLIKNIFLVLNCCFFLNW